VTRDSAIALDNGGSCTANAHEVAAELSGGICLP
jgi:hypothetical protein